LWAAREFGPEYATAIAEIVSKYTKFNGRRKPELLEPNTFSLEHYREADSVLEDFRAITARAEDIYTRLPQEKRDAFYKLVLYPTKASEIVTELYITAGRNHLYAQQGRASTNALAERTRALFQADADLSAQYNHVLAGGKWDHMMDQTHIGYTGWQQPPASIMPAVSSIELRDEAEMGVAPEGSAELSLPQFDRFRQERHYADVFNRGRKGFTFRVATSGPWIRADRQRGTVETEQRVWVTVDWAHVPVGLDEGFVKISQVGGGEVKVGVRVFNPPPLHAAFSGFIETDRYISIESAHYSRKTEAGPAKWDEIKDYGRMLSSMTILPVTAPSANPPDNAARLEYDMYVFHPGEAKVEAILAPSLNFVPGRGLRYGISLDGEPVQIVDALAANTTDDWARSVKDSVRLVTTKCTIGRPGPHILKFWMVDPGVVLHRLMIDLGGVEESYLGPPESFRVRSGQRSWKDESR
jgi:hypothetical protein